MGAVSAAVKRLGHEADKSLSCSAKTNNEWTLPSIPNMSSWNAQTQFYWLFKIHRQQHVILILRDVATICCSHGGRECLQLARICGALTPRPTCSSLVPQLLSLRSWQPGRRTVHACGLWIVREDIPPPARAPCCESDIVCAPGISRFLPPSSYVRDRQCWVASKRTYTLRRAQCTQTNTPSSNVPWTKFLTGKHGWPSFDKIFNFMEIFYLCVVLKLIQLSPTCSELLKYSDIRGLEL